MALGIVDCSNAAASTISLNPQKKKKPEKLGALVSSGGHEQVLRAEHLKLDFQIVVVTLQCLRKVSH